MIEKGIQIIHWRKLFPGSKKVDLDICEWCVYEKNKRVTFLKVEKIKNNENIEFVHTNVWILVQVSFIGGSYYYLTFIDDAIRKT